MIGASMTSRREFVKAGLVGAALPFAARADFASVRSGGTTVPLYKVLYDTRFAASVAFARRAEEAGLAVHATAGDMTRFWYDDLYHRWRREPVAIAGLTAHGALFCLERLAWEERMRVVYRGEHFLAARECIGHRLSGPAALLPAVVEAAAKPDWAAALADAVAECPSGRWPQAMAELGAAAAVTPAAEPLFSWIIAPVARG